MTDDIKQEPNDIQPIEQNKKVDGREPDSINKRHIIVFIVIVVAILGLIAIASFFLMKADNAALTEQLRDVFIIFMALESLIIGIALVILIIQLSSLINLLQNEVRPIINSTNDTVNTIKGTARFVSDNLAEPVIKINQLLAMIKQLLNPFNK